MEQRRLVPTIFLLTVFASIYIGSMMTRALSGSAGAGADGVVTATTRHQQRPSSSSFRILAFGDSLTAGTSPPDYQNYPYAPHLESALSKQSTLQGIDVAVRHAGFPGWTSENLLEEANGSGGLVTTIRRIQDPGLSMVLILAGTNDLGYPRSVNDISESIIGLHKLCYDENVPNTIAISIPSSGYQSMNQEAAEKAYQINQKIKTFCDSEPRASYFSFPFEFERNGEKWSPDGLHFSQNGYQFLGESLAPLVEQIILQNAQ